MSHNEPASSAQPIVGDHQAWPSTRRDSQPHMPYGVSLQPGELLTETWRVWRSDPWRFTAITVLPYGFAMVAGIVLVVAVALMAGEINSFDDVVRNGPLLGLIVGGAGGLFITASLMFIAAAAGTYHATDECLRQEERPEGVIGSLLFGLSSLFRLIGAYAAVGLLMTLAAAPAVGIMAWATSTDTWVLYPVGWIAGVAACAACVVIGIRFCLVGPAIVAEDIGVVAGLNRALALSRGRSLDFFLACLVMGVVTFGLNAVSSVMMVVPFVGLIGQLVVTVIVSSLQSVFFFLLYAGARDLEG